MVQKTTPVAPEDLGEEVAKPKPIVLAQPKVKTLQAESKAIPPKPKIPKPKPVKKESSQITQLVNTMAEKFMQNWTGIIGAMLTVVGIGFLGIYTSLKCAPFYRFIIIDIFSLALVVAFYLLRRKPDWMQLALWLRSIAGAVFLFGCLGSGGIPGLQWIYDPLHGLLLLLLGIAVNLFLGYIGGKQVFASLHVLLSLLALAIAPQTTIIFIVAAVVTLFSLALTYREKWDNHLLLTISLFFIYHIYWKFSLVSGELSYTNHLAALAGVVGVSIAALLVHYRKVYQSAKLAALPLFVHLANWFFFTVGVVLHSEIIPWPAILLGTGAIAGYLLSRRAKLLGIRWLYLTDALVAQFAALTALWLLAELNVGYYTIAGFMFVEILLFSLVAKWENEKVLSRIGSGLANIMGIFLITYGLVKAVYSLEVAKTLLMCSVVRLGYFIYLRTKYRENCDSVIKTLLATATSPAQYNYSLLECLLSVMLVVIYSNIYTYAWSAYGVAGLALVFLFIRQWLQSNGMGLGLILFLFGFHIFGWVHLWHSEALTPLAKFMYSVPMFVLSLAGVWLSEVADLKKQIRYVGKSFFFAHLIFMTYLLFEPLWPLPYVAGAIFIEALLYLVFINPEKEISFHHAGLVMANIFVLGLMAVGLINLDFKAVEANIQKAGTMAICSLAIVGYCFFVRRKYPEIVFRKFKPDKLLFFVGLLLTVGYYCIYQQPWSGYTLLALAVPFMYVRWKYQVSGLGEGLYVLLFLAHGLAWYYLWQNPSLTLTSQLIYALPFLGLSFIQAQWSYLAGREKHVKWPGIYLFFAHIMIATYLLTKFISPFITGVVWLGLSVIVLELANFVRKRHGQAIVQKGEADRYLLQVGYILIAAFLVRHVMVHLQSEAVLALGLTIRLVIELLGLGVLIYWWLQSPPRQEPVYRSWLRLHPLFLELILLFAVLTIAVEVEPVWRPVAWVIMALVILPIRKLRQGEYARLGFYALLFNWTAALNVAFVASAYVTPSTSWYDQAWLGGAIAIVLQFVYIAVTHNKNTLSQANYPVGTGLFQSWSEKVDSQRNLWVYYPLFLCVALFLYWSFDKATLTLLWVIECFAIFVLSVIMRENHFRYLSMLGLVACLIRLVVYDLAKAQTLIRAIVFLGVGIIMIVMNTIYIKYKDRFEKGAQYE